MALIIKITQNGSSQEYLFNKPGPIVIGSDKQCDLYLEDNQLEAKVLEVKVSGGNIFIKEVGLRSRIYLDSVILPYREEVRYQEGKCISLQDTLYQIHIAKMASESIEPPPFFEGEFKERLENMNQKIREKETELKKLEAGQEKKKGQLLDLEDKYHHHSTEKSRLEVEVVSLRSQKETLSHEIRKNLEKKEAEENKILELRDFVKRLEAEEQGLKETIIAQNLVLTNLKEEREKKSKDVDQHRILLAGLQLEATQLQEEIKKLNSEHEHQQQEIQRENNKVEKILSQSEAALRETARVQKHLAELVKEKTILDHDVTQLQNELTKLEAFKSEAQNKQQELKIRIDNEENVSRRIQEEIRRHQEEESNLKDMNGELRSELIKAEEKLSHKKNQLNQIDYQTQDVGRKLSTINFELERSSLRLQELNSEEKVQEMKMLSYREEMQNLAKKASEDKKALQKQFEEEKYKLDLELTALRSEIEDAQKNLSKTESDRNLTQLQLDELHASFRSLSKERSILEAQLSELRATRGQTENQIQNLKEETLKLEHEKGRAQRELAHIQIRLMDCETQIKEKIEEAHLEMENYKRDERAKIAAEKNVFLAEVEAFKQKSLIEVENEYRRKQDDIHQQKQLAQLKAQEILDEARKIESTITLDATARLKQATLDAQEREMASHQRIKEAQEYFKQKEKEADAIIQNSKLESRELMRRTEAELLEDLGRRKQKIKKFLSMKQENGLNHLKALSDQHLIRMKKQEEKGHQHIEDLKKKELKKIARLRDQELSTHQEMKETMMKELQEEKAKTMKSIMEMKRSQEAELSSKKKSMLEHINSTKFSQQKSWEEELKRERELFNRTKKERISNAAAAVMNVLVAETGPQGEKEQMLREKITSTLEMAIEGQSAEALKEVNQVLDFNPLKRKQIIPVLQKYTLRVGLPAAIALVLLTDVGSVRTTLIKTGKEILKQRQSASEIYVNQQKNEWKEKHTFNPATTANYKATFTDNVIYTTDFVKVMESEEFQNDWILKVHDFMVKELELSEDMAINYISAEGTLVKELSLAKKDLHPQFLEQGVHKMRELEKTHLGWLKEKVPETEKMDKFSSFRKSYYEKFYQNQFSGKREVASEVKPSN